jgi:hypothetical protein
MLGRLDGYIYLLVRGAYREMPRGLIWIGPEGEDIRGESVLK